jgi:endonuclease YncB( thermonuclease family)
LTLLLLSAGAASAADWSGAVRVIDGDMLEMGGVRIRLWGIDAPLDQARAYTNQSGFFAFSSKYRTAPAEFVGEDGAQNRGVTKK